MANDLYDNNYYNVLNISDDATIDEIKKAYRKLAVQFHPDKNPRPEAGETFKQLSRAYKVLSSPVQRQQYDFQRKAGLSGQFGGHSWAGFDEDPRKTFRDLFKDYIRFDGNGDDDDFMHSTCFTNTIRISESNNVKMHERSREQNSTQSCEVNQGGFTGTGRYNPNSNKRKPGDFFENQNTSSGPKRTRGEPTPNSGMTEDLPKDPPIERPLELSLEELSTGCTKKLKIKRTINLATGHSRVDSNVLEICVKPGWKAGTRITFPEEGDRNLGSIPADITFIVTDKPHALFSRDSDNNLVHKAKISLKNALLGVSYCIQGLNGKRHDINVANIIHPGFVKRYAGEGLPLPKSPSKRGDLVIEFDIEFPRFLSWDQRRMLSECLPG